MRTRSSSGTVGIVGSPPVTDVGGEVRLGSMLFTLVEPHRGHEVAYNRWYERDHFYAGLHGRARGCSPGGASSPPGR